MRYSRAFFPQRWRLPVRLAAQLASADAEPELRYLGRLCKRFCTAVDVGANHGCYAYRMAQFFEQVYAFEANTQEDYDLWHVRRANVQVFHFGLSDYTGQAILRVPIYNGIPLAGWASTTVRTLPFAEDFQEIPVHLERLDEQPFVHKRSIDLIKVDVEGGELSVLRGAEQVLRRDQPVLIVEDNAEGRTELRAWLEALGYRPHAPEMWLGRRVCSPNLVWIAD